MSFTPRMNPDSRSALLPSRNAMLNFVNTISSLKKSLVFTLFCQFVTQFEQYSGKPQGLCVT